MQNIALRGHEESRNDIWEVSDINRGNFLELLHLRCKDLPWLQSKLQAQLQLHAQWTSPTIQNELLAIVSDLVLERITREVRKSGFFGIIMDETSDISRTEEVSLCLRYAINGETKENFVGFFVTASTEGEFLYELAKTAINKLDLRLENIIKEKKGKGERKIFSWNQPTTRTHFHLSREYQLLTYSLDFFKTKIGSKRLVVLYPPVRGGKGAWTIQMANVKIFFNFFIYLFFLTALSTIRHVTYSKLNSQEKNEIYVQRDLK